VSVFDPTLKPRRSKHGTGTTAGALALAPSSAQHSRRNDRTHRRQPDAVRLVRAETRRAVLNAFLTLCTSAWTATTSLFSPYTGDSIRGDGNREPDGELYLRQSIERVPTREKQGRSRRCACRQRRCPPATLTPTTLGPRRQRESMLKTALFLSQPTASTQRLFVSDHKYRRSPSRGPTTM
jgi:hypothetical protein